MTGGWVWGLFLLERALAYHNPHMLNSFLECFVSFEILLLKIGSCELTYAKIESLKHKSESFEMRLVREHTNTSLFTAVYGK